MRGEVWTEETREVRWRERREVRDKSAKMAV